MLAFAGQSLQPDAIGEQEVIEGAMQAAEEYAGGAAVGFVRHGERGRVEAPIGPMVVVGELPEVFESHQTNPAERGSIPALIQGGTAVRNIHEWAAKCAQRYRGINASARS